MNLVRFALTFAALAASSPDRPVPPDPGFTVTQIAPGVYALIRSEPLGMANHANTVFIVGEEDVVVVDTPFTLAETRRTLDALRRITGKPVSVVVNTHWHDDHTFGNQVYAEAFPGVEIVAHAATREAMATTAVENRRTQLDGGEGALAAFRAAVAGRESLDGTPMSEDERAAYASTIAIVEEYLRDAPHFRLTLPTLSFENRLTLVRGGRTIEILHLGGGNTPGDVVVHLAEEGIVIAGDLVDDPVPATWGGNVGDWIAALERIRALDPRTVVPGHGPLLDGAAHAVVLGEVFASIRDQAAAAAARGETLEAARGSVNLDRFEAALCGGNKMLRTFFRTTFAAPAIGAAYREATGAR